MKLFPLIKVIKENYSKNKKKTYIKKVNESDRAEFMNNSINLNINNDTENFNKKKYYKEDEAINHFIELERVADLVNEDLEKNRHPFRFRIYKNENQVFIDLVRLDKENKIVEIRKKNITHEEFKDLIKHIELTEGLFFEGIG